MQIPNARISPIYPCQSQIQSHPPLELSLKRLTLEPQKNPSHSRSCSIDFMISDDFLSPISSSLLSGDYLGMESCFNVLNDDELGSCVPPHRDCYTHREERSLRWAPKKKCYQEFPPPIPLLARTENLSAHMPWVLKRHYTSDGRLILTEEKVRHHEYFKAHRSNGRLRLQLVPLDGNLLLPPIVCDEDDIDEELDDDECCSDCVDACDCDEDYDYDYKYGQHGDGDDDDDDDDQHPHRDDVEERINIINSSNGSAGKCLNIDSTVGPGSPSILGVPATRWVNDRKANTNGSTKGLLGQAGFGGLLFNHAGRVIGSFSEPIGVSIATMAQLSATIIFAIAIAWRKGWLRYGWKLILSWSYLFSLNPILFLGLCVLSETFS